MVVCNWYLKGYPNQRCFGVAHSRVGISEVRSGIKQTVLDLRVAAMSNHDPSVREKANSFRLTQAPRM